MNATKSYLFVHSNLLRLGIIDPESLYGNGFHPLLLKGTVIIIGPGSGDTVNYLDTLCKLTEGCILAVKMG